MKDKVDYSKVQEKMRKMAKEGKIVRASDELIVRHKDAVIPFMYTIFGYARSTYMVTDESILWDFKGVAGMKTLEDIEAKILKVYGIDVSGMENAKIIDVVIMLVDEEKKQ